MNTKWLLLQNDQNADTTLLHSHDEITPHTNLIVKWLEEAISDVPIVQNKSNISAGRCVPGSNDIACMEELVLAVLSECLRYPVAIAIVHVGFVYYFSC